MDIATIDATVGHSIAKTLAEPMLAIGDKVYTRHDLIKVIGIANMAAAKRLSDTLRTLKIRTLKQLEAIGPAALYRVFGTGHTQVYVAMCVLDANGIDVAGWWGWDVKGSAVQSRARLEKKKRGAHDAPAPKTKAIR